MLQRAMSAQSGSVIQSRRSGRRARMDGTIQVRNACFLPPFKPPLSGLRVPGINFAPKHLRLRWLPTPDANDASSADARPCRARKSKDDSATLNGNPCGLLSSFLFLSIDNSEGK